VSLWTPGGEHEVPRPDERGSKNGPVGAPGAGVPDGGGHQARPLPVGVDPAMIEAMEQLSPEERAQAETMLAEMVDTQDRIASAPAADVIANHLMGFYELAAIHLSQQPPHFVEATVAIEALAAVLDRLQGRLGDAEATLDQALSQIQLAFVQLKQQMDTPDDGGAVRQGDPG